jgi:hypothetical protein
MKLLEKRPARLVLAVTLLALFVLYGVAVVRSQRHLTVVVVNRSGEPLDAVILEEKFRVGRVEPGASVATDVPMTMSPRINYRWSDGKAGANTFLYEDNTGFRHVLRVVFDPKGTRPPGRSMVAVILLGTTIEYHVTR